MQTYCMSTVQYVCQTGYGKIALMAIMQICTVLLSSGLYKTCMFQVGYRFSFIFQSGIDWPDLKHHEKKKVGMLEIEIV